MMRRILGRASLMPAAVMLDAPKPGTTRKAEPPDVAEVREGGDTAAPTESCVTRILAATEMASTTTIVRPVKGLVVTVRALRTRHRKFEQTAADTRGLLLPGDRRATHLIVLEHAAGVTDLELRDRAALLVANANRAIASQHHAGCQ